MSGIFSVLSDSQSTMFRLQQAKKAWERDSEAMDYKDAKQRLTDKAQQAQQPFKLTAEQQRNHTAALGALEEAKRVGGPKAAAEQKLEEVERKIAELKMTMRYSHGNREKLAQLAREAAILAREAGRAAKSYGQGVAAAAELGLPGGAGTSAGAEVVRTVTTTSVTVVQTEMSVNLTVTFRPDAQPNEQPSGQPDGQGNPQPDAQASAAAGAAAALAEGSAAMTENASSSSDGGASQMAADAAALASKATSAATGTDTSTPDGTDETSPDSSSAAPSDKLKELAKTVGDALAGLNPSENGSPANSYAGIRGRALMQRMIADNDMKMSRYREADEFGRRVEKVLATVKSVIGEAKATNEAEQSEERKKARRESFKAYDKIVEGAQDEVNGLRQAAFGTSITAEDVLKAASDTSGQDGAGLDGTGQTGVEQTGGASVDASAAGAGPALAAVQTAVNLLA